MNLLSIDVGFKNPSFIIIEYTGLNIKTIKIYKNILINNIYDSIYYLNYFISKNLDNVIIENQFKGNNISLMRFMEGFFVAKEIPVIRRNPIAHIRPDKGIKSRSEKKNFSINLLNNIFKRENINITFLSKDSDICDSINLGLYYISKDFNITINEVKFINLNII